MVKPVPTQEDGIVAGVFVLTKVFRVNSINGSNVSGQHVNHFGNVSSCGRLSSVHRATNEVCAVGDRIRQLVGAVFDLEDAYGFTLHMRSRRPSRLHNRPKQLFLSLGQTEMRVRVLPQGHHGSPWCDRRPSLSVQSWRADQAPSWSISWHARAVPWLKSASTLVQALFDGNEWRRWHRRCCLARSIIPPGSQSRQRIRSQTTPLTLRMGLVILSMPSTRKASTSGTANPTAALPLVSDVVCATPRLACRQ